jgi:hypothetical protein
MCQFSKRWALKWSLGSTTKRMMRLDLRKKVSNTMILSLLMERRLTMLLLIDFFSLFNPKKGLLLFIAKLDWDGQAA